MGAVPIVAAPVLGLPAIPAGLALLFVAVLVGSMVGAHTGGAGPAMEAAQACAASGSAPEPLQLMGLVGEAANQYIY